MSAWIDEELARMRKEQADARAKTARDTYIGQNAAKFFGKIQETVKRDAALLSEQGKDVLSRSLAFQDGPQTLTVEREGTIYRLLKATFKGGAIAVTWVSRETVSEGDVERREDLNIELDTSQTLCVRTTNNTLLCDVECISHYLLKPLLH
jgi:hypothetical protein